MIEKLKCIKKYCNCTETEMVKTKNSLPHTTDKLQRLLNSAAHLVSVTKTFDRRLTQLMHVDLHWLDVPEWVKCKLVSMVHNCLHQIAPQYLTDCCIPISDVASRRHLRSASRHHLVVLRHNLSTYGHRAFAIAGPAAWNYPAFSTDSFIRVLMTR